MRKVISNGKSSFMPKGKEYEVTEEMYEIFKKGGFIEVEKPKSTKEKTNVEK